MGNILLVVLSYLGFLLIVTTILVAFIPFIIGKWINRR